MVPLVSIVVCSYNYERYVEDAVRSALAQTHPWTEVIVVDDGSTDGSRERLQRWADHVQLLLQPNQGQLSAYNRGFAAAQGEFILFLDADDVLDPDLVTRALAAFSPGVARVHYPLRLLKADGIPTGTHIPRHLAQGNVRDEVVQRGHLFASSPGSGNVYRRSALAQLMPLPLEDGMRLGADFFTVYGSALCGDLAALRQAGGGYRLHAPVSDMGLGLSFGNSAQTQDDFGRVAQRRHAFKRWIHERLGVMIAPALLDFGHEKQVFAACIFSAPSYLAGWAGGLARWPLLWRSVRLMDTDPFWLRWGLVLWAMLVLVLPRPVGWRLARRVCNPASR